MQKIFYVLILLVVLGTVCPVNSFSDDSYLQLRYDFSSDFKENAYILFENNSLEKWAINIRLINASEKLRIFLPTLYYKFGNGFQVGARANIDSFDGKHFGPVFRYKKPMGRFFVIFDASFLKSLKSDGDKFDNWLHVSTRVSKTPWKVGTELRYFGTIGASKYFQLRPIKVTYDINENFSAFVMPQRQWSNSGEISDSVMGGVEFKF